jgi:hypothetical protein
MISIDIYPYIFPTKVKKDLKKNRLLLVGIVILFISISISIYYYAIILLPKSQVVTSGIDKFGVKEIYSTKGGGREWFLNMENPKKDPLFSITDDIPITKQNDESSWFINNSNTRMNVNTPAGDTPWKNIEMTGYVKTIPKTNETNSRIVTNNVNTDNNNDESKSIEDIDWRARGGTHNSIDPCKGTALGGGIYLDGKVAWKKEIWHTGGYTDARGTTKVTNSISDRWIGWKTVIYNIDNNSAVKMESYLDDKDNNEWKKVSTIVDNGGWFANSPDNIFYSANCGKPKDYVITNGGPIATFRADNIAFNFKDFSIREIQPPLK